MRILGADLMANDNRALFPETAIVVGSGCSAGLGVPTLSNFIDEVLSGTIGSGKPEDAQAIKDFIQLVKGSAAYMRTNLLNIEELYGLAEIYKEYGYDEKEKEDAEKVVRILNENIYDICLRAGREFVDNSKGTYEFSAEKIETIKREASIEEILDSEDVVSVTRQTNLLAYLALVSFHDRITCKSGTDYEKRYPLFIQFNWDLALDRAIFLYLQANAKNEEAGRRKGADGYIDLLRQYQPWGGFGDDVFESKSLEDNFVPFKSGPMVVRPHGAINWYTLPVENTDSEKDSGFRNLFGKQKGTKDPGAEYRAMCILKHSAGKSDCNAEVVREYFESGRDRRQVDNVDLDPDLMVDLNQLYRPEDTVQRLNKSIGKKDDCVSLKGLMEISPPTWRKDADSFLGHWREMRKNLEHVRRIIFIGYSFPSSDLFFRHFLAFSLAKNNMAPSVYIWNPQIFKMGEVKNNYLDMFMPLAREGRLFGYDRPFGDPASYDLNRVINQSKKITV